MIVSTIKIGWESTLKNWQWIFKKVCRYPLCGQRNRQARKCNWENRQQYAECFKINKFDFYNNRCDGKEPEQCGERN